MTIFVKVALSPRAKVPVNHILITAMNELKTYRLSFAIYLILTLAFFALDVFIDTGAQRWVHFVFLFGYIFCLIMALQNLKKLLKLKKKD